MTIYEIQICFKILHPLECVDNWETTRQKKQQTLLPLYYVNHWLL